jgi:exodeoxyribonuclease VII small subunit
LSNFRFTRTFHGFMPERTEPPQTFETALARLEHLVDEMEGDKLPLEQLIVAYEEGAKLVKVCQQKLTEAEQKIQIIQRRATGETELRDFDPAKPAAQGADKVPPVASPRPSAKDVSLF